MLDVTNIDRNVRVRCEVTAYQFPRSAADDWCMVRVAIEQGPDSFDRSDPALEAGDITKVRDWFGALAEDRLPRYAHLTFIEPCLSFRFLARESGGVRIALDLAAELRPPFPLVQLSRASKEWSIVALLAPDRLAAVAAACDEASRRFPVRSKPR